MCTMVLRVFVISVLVLFGNRVAAQGGIAPAEDARIDALMAAVVRVETKVLPEAQTAETLGRERRGTGVVIDERGHVLTIGYLVIEAQSIELTTNAGRTVPAALAGYDHATGLAVVRPLAPHGAPPMPLGASSALTEKQVLMTVPFGGRNAAGIAIVVSKREFTGGWEYLLEEAIFTAPPTPQWTGAALVNRDLQLVGIGSLLVRDALGDGNQTPGNLFVPVDIVKPILADLIARGKRSGPPQPWLGVNTSEYLGQLVVTRVSRSGPAAQAGVKAGDLVVGVGSSNVTTQADLYRRIWALGSAGVAVPLRIRRDGEVLDLIVKSTERSAYFRDGAI